MDKVPITFRTAFLHDMDAILEMSRGVYAGMDYLPAKYKSWIKEEVTKGKRRNFVVESDSSKEVVGFFSILFNQTNTKYIMLAARVSQMWRGKGIFHRIQCFVKSFPQYEKINATQMSVFVNYWLSDEDTNRKIQREGKLLQTLGKKVAI